MADIVIDYNDPSLKSSVYQNGYIEDFIFHNIPNEIKFFQIKGVFIFGCNIKNEILITNNYSIQTVPPTANLSHLGKLNIQIGKIPMQQIVNMQTDMQYLCNYEIKDMQKYQPNVIQIGRIILEIGFYDIDNNEIKAFQVKTNIIQDIKFKNIVKIHCGLIEKDNPLLFSKISDFSGGTYVRNEDSFIVYDGYCERNFKNKEFVIIIEKKPNILKDADEYGIYTRKSGRRSGLIECVENQSGNQKTATHWKFIYYDGFIQTYLSYDNMNEWIAAGGGQNIEQTDVQGFYVNSNTPLILKNYNTYDNPYTKFLNIPKGFYVKLYNKNNELKKVKRSINGMVEIYMPSPIYQGYFTICNEKETVIYQSENLDIHLGDIFDDLQYQLEVWYGKNIIERYSTTHIDRYKEIITVKNISEKLYKNIYVNILKEESNIDDIELSFDNITYSKSLIIGNLQSNESINIYIKINANKNTNNYGKKNFSIEFT